MLKYRLEKYLLKIKKSINYITITVILCACMCIHVILLLIFLFNFLHFILFYKKFHLTLPCNLIIY